MEIDEKFIVKQIKRNVIGFLLLGPIGAAVASVMNTVEALKMEKEYEEESE